MRKSNGGVMAILGVLFLIVSGLLVMGLCVYFITMGLWHDGSVTRAVLGAVGLVWGMVGMGAMYKELK